MGAHNSVTREYADRLLRHVAAKINQRSSWAGLLDAIIERGHVSGSLKNWIREGMELETLQLDVKLDGAEPDGIANVWVPGARIVDHAGPTFLHLNGSRRDYAGVTTYAATSDYYVGFTGSSKDRVSLIIYRVLS